MPLRTDWAEDADSETACRDLRQRTACPPNCDMCPHVTPPPLNIPLGVSQEDAPLTVQVEGRRPTICFSAPFGTKDS